MALILDIATLHYLLHKFMILQYYWKICIIGKIWDIANTARYCNIALVIARIYDIAIVLEKIVLLQKFWILQ